MCMSSVGYYSEFFVGINVVFVDSLRIISITLLTEQINNYVVTHSPALCIVSAVVRCLSNGTVLNKASL